MNRGPVALFGAIVAVGLGPALWLGANLGRVVDLSPSSPPAAVSDQQTTGTGDYQGGEGAGETPSDDPTTSETHEANTLPLTVSPAPPGTVTTSPSAPASSEPTQAPTSGDPATTPTDGTGQPTGPSTGGDPSTGEPGDGTSDPTGGDTGSGGDDGGGDDGGTDGSGGEIQIPIVR